MKTFKKLKKKYSTKKNLYRSTICMSHTDWWSIWCFSKKNVIFVGDISSNNNIKPISTTSNTHKGRIRNTNGMKQHKEEEEEEPQRHRKWRKKKERRRTTTAQEVVEEEESQPRRRKTATRKNHELLGEWRRPRHAWRRTKKQKESEGDHHEEEEAQHEGRKSIVVKSYGRTL